MLGHVGGRRERGSILWLCVSHAGSLVGGIGRVGLQWFRCYQQGSNVGGVGWLDVEWGQVMNFQGTAIVRLKILCIMLAGFGLWGGCKGTGQRGAFCIE